MHGGRGLLAALVVALVVGACAGGDEASEPTSEGTTATTAPVTASTAPPTTASTAPVALVTGSGTLRADEGGVVVSEDGLFALVVPPGALAEDTELGVTQVASADLPGPLAGAQIRGAVHDVQPGGLRFAEPATVLRLVDTAAVGFSPDEAPLVDLVSASDDDVFEALGETRVVDLGDWVLVSGTTDHLTDFLALGHPGSMIDVSRLTQVPLARDYLSAVAASPTSDLVLASTDGPVTDPVVTGAVDRLADRLVADGGTPSVAAVFEELPAVDAFGLVGALAAPDETFEREVLGTPLVPVDDLGGPSFCDRPIFLDQSGAAVVPLHVTPPPDARLPLFDVPRPATVVLFPARFDCTLDPAGPPPDEPVTDLALASAAACVVHDPYESFLSYLRLLLGFSGDVESLTLTVSNGANGGDPVEVEPGPDGLVEARLGIPSYATYDVVEAVARGTDGQTVDLTAAIQAALGSLEVTAQEGPLGATPPDACD